MAVAQKVIVEEIEMAAGKAVDFGERFIDALGVKAAAALEERILVAEVAMLRAAAGDDDGIGNEIRSAADEVAANGRDALKGTAGGRGIDGLRNSRAEVSEELRERLIARAEKDGVGVRSGF